jgi:hypothetical protein
MSEEDDTPNMTPLSSNSSGSSGTRAWSVSVADDPENTQPDKNSPASDQTESSAAPMTGNEHIEHSAAASDLPAAETDAFASEAVESFDALVGQAVQDLPDPYDPGETDPQPTASDAAGEEADTGIGTADAPGDAAPETPADETLSAETDEEQTTEQLRQAVLDSLAQQEEKREEAMALFERISGDFSARMAAARTDAAAFSLKLMEFAQANAQSNFELARGYSNARSIPEIFTVQADYLKRQLELLNAQARELQAMTAKVAAKTTMDIQNRRDAD